MVGAPLVPRRRRTPDDPVAFSALALVPEPPGAATPAAIASTAEILVKCRARGVTTFDVAGARDPAVAAVCLARAFGEERAGVIAIVPETDPPGSSARSLRGTPAGMPAKGSRDGLPSAAGQATANELLVGFPRVVEIGGELSPRGGPEAALTNSRDVRSEPDVIDVSVRCPSGDDVRRALRFRPRPLVTGELSLLDPASSRFPEGIPDAPGAWFIARNVFANGRLDGTAWPGSLRAGSTMGPPESVRDLAGVYEPVLRFGFLTQGARRTLAQAALGYVLGCPWVLLASARLPPVDRLDELLGFSRAPPLGPDDLRRVESMREKLAPGRSGE